MAHILDNPIYNALSSAHSAFAQGNEEIKFYLEEVSPFAGFKENGTDSLDLLFDLTEEDRTFVVFTPQSYEIPKKWELITQIDMFQMVYEGDDVPSDMGLAFQNLDHSHVDEMIELVKLTQPGPFKKKTIDLSNYIGIFSEGKLVSMAGHRFHPEPYIEISAVCTHPDHFGKGYAFQLLREQIIRILGKNQVPFLHVRDDNTAAVSLYKKLGFTVRIPMLAYVVKKGKEF
ncbi:MAG: GNAT family N-acetyltransferase [Pedobacter sp.]|nr:MAG: GNAT family N-acetyltransferase [Pedobacter sp.]